MKAIKKKMTSAILAVITCLTSTATVLDHKGNSSSPIGSITAEAASSDRILSFDWNLITGVGRQAKGSDSCACFALAFGRSVLDGYVHSWSEFNKYGGGSQTGTMCMWSYGDYTKHYASSQLGALQAAYDQLNMGRPVVVFVTGSRSTWHWITLLGYRAGADRNDLSPYDFYMTDPCKSANSYENMGEAGYSVKYEGSSGYAYVTANSGGVPLGGAEPEPVIPDKPVVHVDSTDSSHDVIISYNACTNATHYDLRFYRSSDDAKVWCIGQCDDGAAFGNLVTYTDTSYSHRFDSDEYYVTVAAVNINSGKWNYSDKVYFSVTEAKKCLSITYNANDGEIAEDSAYYVTDDGMIYDSANNSPYTTVWELGKGSENGLRNDSSFKLQRNNYTFLGWSLSKDDSTTVFDMNDTTLTTNELCPGMNNNAKTTVYAIWTRNSLSGDINEDNLIDNSDLELLRDWLLADKNVTLNDPKAADLNGDGALNGIDLTLLKRKILISESIVITINKKSVMMNTEGASKTFQLQTSYISPDDIVWTSSNPSIVTVKDGLLTAQKDGKATVTANVNGQSLAISVEVKTAYTESWSKKSDWDKTPVTGSDTRKVYTEERPETREVVNLAYCCARTKGDHIRQFYKDMINPAALGLDTVYGVNTTQGVFGVPYITKSLAEIEQATKIQNNERSYGYGDQWGYNRSGQVGYCFDNACIWFEIGRNTETITVTYYCYEDLIKIPVVYDND